MNGYAGSKQEIYSLSWKIMEEFAQFAKYLTKDELQQVKKRLENQYKTLELLEKFRSICYN